MFVQATLLWARPVTFIAALDQGAPGRQVGLAPSGKQLHNAALPNSEPKLREVFDKLARHGRILVVVDQPATIGALPVTGIRKASRRKLDSIAAQYVRGWAPSWSPTSSRPERANRRRPGQLRRGNRAAPPDRQLENRSDATKNVASDGEEILDAHPLARPRHPCPASAVRTAARILLEIGDASAIKTSAHLAVYAGIAPVTRRSGTSIRGQPPARTGNRRLKRDFFLAPPPPPPTPATASAPTPASASATAGCAALHVPMAERQEVSCLDELTTAGTVALGHIVTADWTGLTQAGLPQPRGVPGIPVDGYFPDTSTTNTNHGWNHDAQFVVRLLDRWNGGLVATGSPGNRRQYANDRAIADFVLSRRLRLRRDRQGQHRRDLYKDGHNPGDAVAEWNHRVTQLTAAAKAVAAQRHGHLPRRTLMAGG
jgi:hypothetical protein